MKTLPITVENCGECPYASKQLDDDVLCSNLSGGPDNITAFYYDREIPADCPLEDIDE